ncbi:MAG: sigma 54-interacting transcriptional regulator [Deltaproteobacteria bacterium]|nr:sigma 54-interacting transcriptional regulator [Deltaproteobacteria bacterium]
MEIPELVFVREDQTLLHFPINRAEVCIGSNPTNDIVLPDTSTIPAVAAIIVERGGGRFRLRDLTNGVLRVNDASLEGDECDLGPGDVVRMGPYALRLQVKNDDGPRQGFGRTSIMSREDSGPEGASIEFSGKRYRLDPSQPFNVGGHDDNDLLVEDAFASAFHCRVTNQRGRWILMDLGSTNGTEVNGLRIREAELPSPAVVRIGRTSFTFEEATAGRRMRDTTDDKNSLCRFHGMIGQSDALRRVFDLATRLAGSKEPVLIIGASGSGKELVARALHAESPRADGPYLALNCGALTSTLIESELFGHVKGAFTGATSDKQGAFEATTQGTLFLDEIGELPLDLQPKLLRVLEASSVRRVGGTQEIPVHTRIVAATHRNLEELVREGKFREDLFHRLFVLSIRIPPLAERPEDVIPLAEHFIATQSTRPVALAADAQAALTDYTWPGNVRELRNVIVRALLMTDSDTLQLSDLEFLQQAFTTRSQDARGSVRRHDERERAKLLDALDTAGGNRAEAARILGVSKSTFHDRLKRYGVPLKFGPRS